MTEVGADRGVGRVQIPLPTRQDGDAQVAVPPAVKLTVPVGLVLQPRLPSPSR